MLDDSKAIDTRTDAPLDDKEAGNRLLAALAPGDRAALMARHSLETVGPGQVLLEPDEPPADLLFPLAGTVLAHLALLPGCKPVETAMIGPEGAAGALFGPQTARAGFRIQTLTRGTLLRVPAGVFGEILEASADLRARMRRYLSALLAQVQIGAACAALHPVEARVARWMLSLQDRTGERSLPLTQETLADLLGVRRTTITRVIATLEARGLVRHRRGRIIVMDRPGLERACCECHALVRERFEDAMPSLYPSAQAGG